MKRAAIGALALLAVCAAGYGTLRQQAACGALDSGKAACSAALATGKAPSEAVRLGIKADAEAAGFGNMLFPEQHK